MNDENDGDIKNIPTDRSIAIDRLFGGRVTNASETTRSQKRPRGIAGAWTGGPAGPRARPGGQSERPRQNAGAGGLAAALATAVRTLFASLPGTSSLLATSRSEPGEEFHATPPRRFATATWTPSGQLLLQALPDDVDEDDDAWIRSDTFQEVRR